jgi:hypothetical protein
MSVVRILRERWRVFVFGWALLVLPWILSDFFLRVHVPRDGSLRAFAEPAELQVEPAIGLGELRQQLQQLFPPPVSTVNTERVMTLQAVFSSGTTKSAFISAAAPDGQVERIRAPVGHVIDGWTVDAVESRKVILKRGEERRELVMFGKTAN